MTDTKKFKAKCTAVVSPIEKEEFLKFFENLYGSTRATHLSFQIGERTKYTRTYGNVEEFKRFEFLTKVSTKNFKGEDLYNLLKSPTLYSPIFTLPIPDKYSVEEIQFQEFHGEEKGRKITTPVEMFNMTTVPGWLPYTPQGRGVIEAKIEDLQTRINAETKNGWDWKGERSNVIFDLLLNPDSENMPELNLYATFNGEGRDGVSLSTVTLYLMTFGEFDLASAADNNYDLIQHQNSVRAAALLEDRLGRWLDITGRIKPETVNFN